MKLSWKNTGKEMIQDVEPRLPINMNNTNTVQWDKQNQPANAYKLGTLPIYQTGNTDLYDYRVNRTIFEPEESILVYNIKLSKGDKIYIRYALCEIDTSFRFLYGISKNNEDVSVIPYDEFYYKGGLYKYINITQSDHITRDFVYELDTNIESFGIKAFGSVEEQVVIDSIWVEKLSYQEPLKLSNNLSFYNYYTCPLYYNQLPISGSDNNGRVVYGTGLLYNLQNMIRDLAPEGPLGSYKNTIFKGDSLFLHSFDLSSGSTLTISWAAVTDGLSMIIKCFSSIDDYNNNIYSTDTFTNGTLDTIQHDVVTFDRNVKLIEFSAGAAADKYKVTGLRFSELI
jgi:hypothetical protein